MEKKTEPVCWQDGNDLYRVLLTRHGDDVIVTAQHRMVGEDEWTTLRHTRVPVEAWLDMAGQLATEEQEPKCETD